MRVVSRRDTLRTLLHGAVAPCAVSFGVGLSAARAAAAAPWPSRPIRLIVPFPPAGSTNILAREIALSLQEALGQPVVVENEPGAGGSIGSTEAARAGADGYMLAMGHIGTLAINPSLYPKLSYDPRTSFAPVALIARVPNVLVVNPRMPAKDVRELVALAKTKPGELRYASGGNGSAAHLAMEYFKLKTGVDIVHVPYRGTSPAVTDVLAGQVEMTMTGVPAVQQQVKAVAPAGIPAEIVQRLNAEINRALATDKLKARLEAEGAIAAPDSPAAFGALITSEIARWNPVVVRANMRSE